MFLLYPNWFDGRCDQFCIGTTCLNNISSRRTEQNLYIWMSIPANISTVSANRQIFQAILTYHISLLCLLADVNVGLFYVTMSWTVLHGSDSCFSSVSKLWLEDPLPDASKPTLSPHDQAVRVKPGQFIIFRGTVQSANSSVFLDISQNHWICNITRHAWFWPAILGVLAFVAPGKFKGLMDDFKSNGRSTSLPLG